MQVFCYSMCPFKHWKYRIVLFYSISWTSTDGETNDPYYTYHD